jgi:hypothetical protein
VDDQQDEAVPGARWLPSTVTPRTRPRPGRAVVSGRGGWQPQSRAARSWRILPLGERRRGRQLRRGERSGKPKPTWLRRTFSPEFTDKLSGNSGVSNASGLGLLFTVSGPATRVRAGGASWGEHRLSPACRRRPGTYNHLVAGRNGASRAWQAGHFASPEMREPCEYFEDMPVAILLDRRIAVP